VVAHGNSLRALVMHLDGLNDEQVAGLDIATGAPMVYLFDHRLRSLPVAAGCRYLDPVTASEAIRIGPA
jgi:2,3-bisphosphoglycerate-dependent phosphoglycerate mutase